MGAKFVKDYSGFSSLTRKPYNQIFMQENLVKWTEER